MKAAKKRRENKPGVGRDSVLPGTHVKIVTFTAI